MFISVLTDFLTLEARSLAKHRVRVQRRKRNIAPQDITSKEIGKRTRLMWEEERGRIL